MKTKVIAGLVVLAVAALAVAGLTGHLGSKKVHLGVVLPLTGKDGPLGLGIRNSIQLAVDEVNARGGLQGRAVVMDLVDDGSEKARSTQALQRLMKDDKILGTLEFYDPECAHEIGESGLTDIGFPTIFIGIAKCDPTFFNSIESRIFPGPGDLMAVGARHAWEVLGARKYLFIDDGTSYGGLAINQFRRGLSNFRGARVTGNNPRIAPGNTDFSAILAKAQEDKTDYIFYAGEPLEGALLFNALRNAGFAGGFELESDQPLQPFTDNAKNKGEGTYTVFPGLPDELTEPGRKFLADYAAHGFKEPPSAWGIYGYVGAQAMLSGMDKSFLVRHSLLGALEHEQLDTLFGRFEFQTGGEDHSAGSTYRTLVLYKAVQGKWTPFYLTDATKKLRPYP